MFSHVTPTLLPLPVIVVTPTLLPLPVIPVSPTLLPLLKARYAANSDSHFNRDKDDADCDTACSIKTNSQQLDYAIRETNKDSTLSKVVLMLQEGWKNSTTYHDPDIRQFRKITDSLSVANGYLFYGTRLIILTKLQQPVLKFLHSGALWNAANEKFSSKRCVLARY